MTVSGAVCVGVDADRFNWLDAPDPELLNDAVQQLRYLEAMEQQNGQWSLTDFGKLVIDLQA